MQSASDVLRQTARALLLGAVGVLAACSSAPAGQSKDTGFHASQLIKADMDRVADAHRRQIDASLHALADKLYRRNPREWKKAGLTSHEAAMARLFANPQWNFAELQGKAGTDAILLGLREDYRGDRVLALIAGMGGMLHAAFKGKQEFYLTDDLDPQSLYNAARNLEIADWKLTHAHNAKNEPLLLSNEMAGSQNLSFEREFGRMIGNLDLLSALLADKTQRTVVKVVQSMATAIFLPIAMLK